MSLNMRGALEKQIWERLAYRQYETQGMNRLIHKYLQDEKKTRRKMKTKEMSTFQGLSKEVNSAKQLERNSQKDQRKSENKSREEQNFSRKES